MLTEQAGKPLFFGLLLKLCKVSYSRSASLMRQESCKPGAVAPRYSALLRLLLLDNPVTKPNSGQRVPRGILSGHRRCLRGLRGYFESIRATLKSASYPRKYT